MPESLLRGKRAVAVVVAATLVGVSAAVLLSGQNTTARAAAAPGSTVRASESTDGVDTGGANSELSADGTSVVFTSYSLLDDLPHGYYEAVYIRDLRSNRTTMISRGQFTRPDTEGPTSEPTTSPTTTTTTPTFEGPKLAGKPLVSLNGRRVQEGPEFGEVEPNGNSSDPTISADGRFVAFVSQADNIVLEDDDTDQDLLVCDRDPDNDGEFDERGDDDTLDYAYFRVNEPQWDEGDGYRFRTDYPQRPKMADDGTRVVWEDELTDDNGTYHEVVRTATVSVAGAGPTEVVTTPFGTTQPTHQEQPDVSSDGRFVVLVADYIRREGPVEFPTLIPHHAVVRKDMVTGGIARVDLDEDTTLAKPVYLSADESVHLESPAISGDGGTIAFEAEAYEDYCSEGTCWYSVADQPTVYVARVQEDGTAIDSTIGSQDNEGQAVNGIRPALSGDGRFLAFVTDNAGAHDGVDIALDYYDSSCLTSSDSTGRGLPPVTDERGRRVVCQVVVRDMVVDRERRSTEQPRLPGTLASPGTGRNCEEGLPEDATCGGNGNSPPYGTTAPSLSRNGSTIGYDSEAGDLVPDLEDDNERDDVFVRTFRPELRADPTPLEFGELNLGETLDRVVRFDHSGFGPLVVTELTIDGSDEFAVGANTCVGPETVVLQQTGTCEVSVTFTPDTEGERTGTLVVRLRDGREFTVPLSGTGVEEEPPPGDARFAASPDPLAFGDRLLMSTAPAQAVTVTNTGGSDLTVSGVTVESPLAPDDFVIASDTCTDAPVAPGSTCQVAITFSPQGSGPRAAVLRFTDDIPGGTPHLIGLSGSAGAPAVEVSPGVSQPGRTVTVSGTGYAPNRPVTITVTGSVETAKVTANAEGTFSTNMLILSKSPIGTHPVVATIDETEPPISAAKPLLIVVPSVSPADFVIRN